MFLLNSANVLVLIICGIKDAYSQMDISLREPIFPPNLYLPPDGLETFPESAEFEKNHDFINDEIRRMGEIIDSEMNKHFVPILNSRNPNVPHIPTEKIGPISDDISNSHSFETDGNEENPLLEFMKFIDSSLQPPKIIAGLDSPTVRKNKLKPLVDQGDENVIQNVPMFTIITLDQDLLPFRQNATSQIEDASNLESSIFQGFLDTFVDTMKDMMNLLENSSTTLHLDENNIQTVSNQPSVIQIRDHERIYEIPQLTLMNRSFPYVLNISWISDLENFNNSLSMNVSKTRDGAILLDHIRLRISNEGNIQDYNRDLPVRMEDNNSNTTEINLGDGVDLKFSHSYSLDNVPIEKRGKFPFQWMAVSIALLGLIVAGLVMLLSYILHAKNRYYARKDSMFKEPMA